MSNCIKDLYDYDLVKKCSKFGIISLKSNFHKNKNMKDGLQPSCVPCVKQIQKQYYNENPDKRRKYYLENRDRLLNKQKFYIKDNRDQIKEYQKKYYLDNRDQLIEYKKQYFQQNKIKINKSYKQYVKSRRESDLKFKLACNFRSRTNKAFKSQNVRKTNKTFNLLGCSHSFFKNWIIHQSYGNMTIENYGSVRQIDHCLPIVSFNLLDENDMKKCFNWVNLRPMYSTENNSKIAKIDHRLYLLQQIKAKFFLKINNDEEGLN